MGSRRRRDFGERVWILLSVSHGFHFHVVSLQHVRGPVDMGIEHLEPQMSEDDAVVS